VWGRTWAGASSPPESSKRPLWGNRLQPSLCYLAVSLWLICLSAPWCGGEAQIMKSPDSLLVELGSESLSLLCSWLLRWTFPWASPWRWRSPASPSGHVGVWGPERTPATPVAASRPGDPVGCLGCAGTSSTHQLRVKAGCRQAAGLSG